MDNPVADIAPVIHSLTQGTPHEQEDAIRTYFVPNASFTHPFCRTGRWQGSRAVILSIYRWYKIMSPRIEIRINSVGMQGVKPYPRSRENHPKLVAPTNSIAAFDEVKLIVYVNITQVFALWFIPFHRSPATLTTQLQLIRPPGSLKYFIQSQNDLYQTDQSVRFVAPWGIGPALVLFWNFWATVACAILAYIFTPFTALEQRATEDRTGLIDGASRFIIGGIGKLADKRIKAGVKDERRWTKEKQKATDIVEKAMDLGKPHPDDKQVKE